MADFVASVVGSGVLSAVVVAGTLVIVFRSELRAAWKERKDQQ